MAAREVIDFQFRAQLTVSPMFPARLLPEPVAAPPIVRYHARANLSALFSRDAVRVSRCRREFTATMFTLSGYVA